MFDGRQLNYKVEFLCTHATFLPASDWANKANELAPGYTSLKCFLKFNYVIYLWIKYF